MREHKKAVLFFEVVVQFPKYFMKSFESVSIEDEVR